MNREIDKENLLLEKFRKLDSFEQSNVISHIDFALATVQYMKKQYGLPLDGEPKRSA
jgi:hypothetical protein